MIIKEIKRRFKKPMVKLEWFVFGIIGGSIVLLSILLLIAMVDTFEKIALVFC